MIRQVAAMVRRAAADVVLVAAALERLATPTARLEILAGQLAARCPSCHAVIGIRASGELGRIAELLARRPDPETRTALMHETADDIAAENAAHGLPGDEEHEHPHDHGGEAAA